MLRDLMSEPQMPSQAPPTHLSFPPLVSPHLGAWSVPPNRRSPNLSTARPMANAPHASTSAPAQRTVAPRRQRSCCREGGRQRRNAAPGGARKTSRKTKLVDGGWMGCHVGKTNNCPIAYTVRCQTSCWTLPLVLLRLHLGKNLLPRKGFACLCLGWTQASLHAAADATIPF